MPLMFCSACGAQWNSNEQAHRTGIDCAVGLRTLIDSAIAEMKKTRKLFQDFADTTAEKEESLLLALKELRDRNTALEERLVGLLRRVNVLEHPKMVNVPSVTKMLSEEKAKETTDASPRSSPVSTDRD